MLKWNEQGKEDMVNNLMDLAANIERHRCIVLLAVNETGGFTIIKHRASEANTAEFIGLLGVAYEVAKKDCMEGFRDVERPCSGEEIDRDRDRRENPEEED